MRFWRFVRSARETDLGLEDLLIGEVAHIHGCESVITFDKKAARSGMFELLK